MSFAAFRLASVCGCSMGYIVSGSVSLIRNWSEWEKNAFARSGKNKGDDQFAQNSNGIAQMTSGCTPSTWMLRCAGYDATGSHNMTVTWFLWFRGFQWVFRRCDSFIAEMHAQRRTRNARVYLFHCSSLMLCSTLKSSALCVFFLFLRFRVRCGGDAHTHCVHVA